MGAAELDSCLDDERLQALAEHRLPPESVQEIEAHVAACDVCRPLVADLVRGGEERAPSGLRRLEHFDRYRLLQRIGGGAMGDVYLGRDTLLDRLVAIKFIAEPEPDLAMARASASRRAPSPGCSIPTSLPSIAWARAWRRSCVNPLTRR
jgi:hypothetical protein